MIAVLIGPALRAERCNHNGVQKWWTAPAVCRFPRTRKTLTGRKSHSERERESY